MRKRILAPTRLRRPLLCLAVALCTLLLSGCQQRVPLRLPGLGALKTQLLESLPDIDRVELFYYSGSLNVHIQFTGEDITDETACSAVLIVRETFIQKDFQERLQEELHFTPSFGPEVYVDLYDPNWSYRLTYNSEDIQHRKYSFWGRYNLEIYNSGRDPSDYTYDGYSRWVGNQFFTGWQRAISMEEIERTGSLTPQKPTTESEASS
ncbi:hypothetical protein AALA61_00100 [Oscillospiraceae bacterium 42-9]